MDYEGMYARQGGLLLTWIVLLASIPWLCLGFGVVLGIAVL